MGANCCIAARDKPLPNRVSREVSTYRNFGHSPSWSFQWDNRTHIKDIVENPVHFSHHNSGNATSEAKSAADTETDGLSDGENSPKVFQAPLYRKSLKSGGFENAKDIAADQSTAGNSSSEVMVDDPSSSLCGFIPSGPTCSRKTRRSPGYQLYRQISDGRIPSLKSLNECSSPEVGSGSFVLSNDLSAGGSHAAHNCISVGYYHCDSLYILGFCIWEQRTTVWRSWQELLCLQ